MDHLVEMPMETQKFSILNKLAPRGRLVGWGLLLVLFVTLLAFIHYVYTASNTQSLAADRIAAARALFQRVQPLTEADVRELRTYRNKEHVEVAERLGITGIVDRENAASIASEGRLVRLRSTPTYGVEKMEYSIPYVTEHTRNLLDTIGMQFHVRLHELGLPPYRFWITSATRTRQDQIALRRVNANAAATSSHEYGTTVDLRYNRFSYAPAADSLPRGFAVNQRLLSELVQRHATELGRLHPEKLKAVLGRTLADLQRDGKVLVIHERLQPVYHITVADSIGDAPELAGRDTSQIKARDKG